MLKGVNRQIIEVNEPDSIYFEKAVFYLRPGVRKLPAEISRREIDRCMSGEGGFFRRRNAISRLLRSSTYIAAVLIITAIILLIF
ncbi:MAG: hypothetical protein IKP42_00375 [Ruminococcus sp.]|nr:hypothetical protein [Ruminococcus sp.]